MPLITWDDSYSVGVKTIDDQHKKLFDHLNNLFLSIKNKESKEHFKKIIMDLADYVDYHFSFEEEKFKEFNYENTESHIKNHHVYIEKIKEFEEKIKNDQLTTPYEMMDFLENWIFGHITIEDKKYSDCFLKNGLA
jgi:hemerythrin